MNIGLYNHRANCFSINFQVFTNNNQYIVQKLYYLHYCNIILTFIYLILLYKRRQKAKNHSHWPVTITSETVNLDQSKCRNQQSPGPVVQSWFSGNPGLKFKPICVFQFIPFLYFRISERNYWFCAGSRVCEEISCCKESWLLWS